MATTADAIARAQRRCWKKSHSANAELTKRISMLHEHDGSHCPMCSLEAENKRLKQDLACWANPKSGK